jgi:hypothetical protein
MTGFHRKRRYKSPVTIIVGIKCQSVAHPEEGGILLHGNFAASMSSSIAMTKSGKNTFIFQKRV